VTLRVRITRSSVELLGYDSKSDSVRDPLMQFTAIGFRRFRCFVKTVTVRTEKYEPTEKGEKGKIPHLLWEEFE